MKNKQFIAEKELKKIIKALLIEHAGILVEDLGAGKVSDRRRVRGRMSDLKPGHMWVRTREDLPGGKPVRLLQVKKPQPDHRYRWGDNGQLYELPEIWDSGYGWRWNKQKKQWNTYRWVPPGAVHAKVERIQKLAQEKPGLWRYFFDPDDRAVGMIPTIEKWVNKTAIDLSYGPNVFSGEDWYHGFSDVGAPGTGAAQKTSGFEMVPAICTKAVVLDRHPGVAKGICGQMIKGGDAEKWDDEKGACLVKYKCQKPTGQLAQQPASQVYDVMKSQAKGEGVDGANFMTKQQFIDEGEEYFNNWVSAPAAGAMAALSALGAAGISAIAGRLGASGVGGVSYTTGAGGIGGVGGGLLNPVGWVHASTASRGVGAILSFWGPQLIQRGLAPFMSEVAAKWTAYGIFALIEGLAITEAMWCDLKSDWFGGFRLYDDVFKYLDPVHVIVATIQRALPGGETGNYFGGSTQFGGDIDWSDEASVNNFLQEWSEAVHTQEDKQLIKNLRSDAQTKVAAIKQMVAEGKACEDVMKEVGFLRLEMKAKEERLKAMEIASSEEKKGTDRVRVDAAAGMKAQMDAAARKAAKEGKGAVKPAAMPVPAPAPKVKPPGPKIRSGQVQKAQGGTALATAAEEPLDITGKKKSAIKIKQPKQLAESKKKRLTIKIKKPRLAESKNKRSR